MIFETDRFIIRHFTMEDLEPFYDMQSNEKVMRYIKNPLNYEESKEELRRFINYYTDTSIFFHLWAIEDKGNQDFIGLCGVYHNDFKENEIAYRLREQYWGKGIGKEVAKALIAYCLDTLDMKQIVANADEGNVGSVRILEGEMRFVERSYNNGRGRYSRKYVLHRK